MLPELASLFEAAVDAVIPQQMLPEWVQLHNGILFIDEYRFDLERYRSFYLCFVWKEIGTSSVHLPQTHELI